MIWRTVMLAMQLGLLAIVGLAAWLGPSNAPMFDQTRRMPAPNSGLTGGNASAATDDSGEFDWRAGKFGTRFELKEYHLAMARDWLAVAAAKDLPGEIKPTAMRAAEHARRALAEGPANGYAWIYLAWAEKLAGREEEARAALSASWRWAPYSRNIAFSRMQLASEWWPILAPMEREKVLIDVLVAYGVEKERVRAEIKSNPRIRAIWRLARAYRQKLREAKAEAAGE